MSEPSLVEALHRTLLLMRDEISAEAPDSVLVHALTSTRIALVAAAEDLNTHCAQTAYITAALLMAHSGHAVHLIAPDVPIIGHQPPLPMGGIISSLLQVGRDLLPGVEFSATPPESPLDMVVFWGQVDSRFVAPLMFCAGASRWAGSLRPCNDKTSWSGASCPMGGLAAGGLISAEAFKVSMRRLRPFAATAYFDEMVAAVPSREIVLAPEATPVPTNFGEVVLVSAGAIVNSFLFCSARIPNAAGDFRAFDRDISDTTNLNRNMLLLSSSVGQKKVDLLGRAGTKDLAITPVPHHFEANGVGEIGLMKPRFIVGVDDIPVRWAVQKQSKEWLGIGATSHWMAMSSFHQGRLACAGCLHNRDEPGLETIPTVAIVSFWAGLWLATQFLRSYDGNAPECEQQVIFYPLTGRAYRCPVAISDSCALHGECRALDQSGMSKAFAEKAV
jgi:hypothetical protein